MESSNEGYLLCVFGKLNYFNLANRIIKNIFDYDSKRKICILTDNIDFFQENKNDRIILIKFDFNNHLHENIDCKNDWNKYGLIPKLYQYKYTPFEKTCFMDVDMIFHKNFTFIWDEFNRSNNPILIGGKCDQNNKSPSNWHWYHIDKVINACGFNCPQVWGTVFIYNKDFHRLVTEYNIIEEIISNVKKYKILSNYNHGYPDEIFYSIILGKFNISPSQLIDEWFYDKTNCDSCNKII